MTIPQKPRTISRAVVSLAAAVTLIFGTAGPAPSRESVLIRMRIFPESAFVLTPRHTGVLATDSGMITGDWSRVRRREVVRDGQKIGIYVSTWKLVGRRGTLTIRERRERTARAGGVDDAGVAVGSWTVVSGTDMYASVAGGGTSAHVGRGNPWYARLDGSLATG